MSGEGFYKDGTGRIARARYEDGEKVETLEVINESF